MALALPAPAEGMEQFEASSSSRCEQGWCYQQVQAVAATLIASQEQGELEEPAGVIRASSYCSYPFLALSNWNL